MLLFVLRVKDNCNIYIYYISCVYIIIIMYIISHSVAVTEVWLPGEAVKSFLLSTELTTADH